MTRYICSACGAQNEERVMPPDECPICTDDRQYFPPAASSGRRLTRSPQPTASVARTTANYSVSGSARHSRSRNPHMSVIDVGLVAGSEDDAVASARQRLQIFVPEGTEIVRITVIA